MPPFGDDQFRYMDDAADLYDGMVSGMAGRATVIVRAVVVGMIRDRGCGLNRDKAQHNGEH